MIREPARSDLDLGILARLHNVTKAYHTRHGELLACDQINLTVRKGGSVGIVGESGSGKSTLVRILQLIVRPTEGEVWLDEVRVSSLPERKLKPYRRNVQFVAQDPFGSLFPHMTVIQNVMEPLYVHGIGDRTSREGIALALLEQVGLSSDHLFVYPHEISGGQQQRVAIARALSLSPQLLILDEAVASLDVSIQAQVLNLLQELKKGLGLTFVFVSHNLAVIRQICDETVVMYLGRIVEQGNSRELFRNPSHPYTQALVRSIPAFTATGVTPLPPGKLMTGELVNSSGTSQGCSYYPRCPFAERVCLNENPELRQLRDGRWVSCHFAERLGAFSE